MASDTSPQTAVLHVSIGLPRWEKQWAKRGTRWACDLQFWRRCAGYKRQADFGKVLGISRNKVAHIESGSMLPAKDLALDILEALKAGLGFELLPGWVWADDALEAIAADWLRWRERRAAR